MLRSCSQTHCAEWNLRTDLHFWLNLNSILVAWALLTLNQFIGTSCLVTFVFRRCKAKLMRLPWITFAQFGFSGYGTMADCFRINLHSIESEFQEGKTTFSSKRRSSTLMVIRLGWSVKVTFNLSTIPDIDKCFFYYTSNHRGEKKMALKITNW